MLSVGSTDGAFHLHSDDDSEADRTRIATILAAYIDVEHAHAFRRVLWRRLGVVTASWVAAWLLTRPVPGGVFLEVDVMLCIAGVMGPFAEWRAERKLARLLGGVE